MPFSASDIVLVTGANGHVAQHVVEQLLARPDGPAVRATVRSESSAAQLSSHWSSAVSSGRLTIVRVTNLLDPAALAPALANVTHIAHLASPLTFGVEDVVNDMLKPAIEGTTGILTAALSVPSVRSVAVTGSFVSVADTKHGLRPGYTYTVDDWNPISYAEAADPKLDLTQWPEKYRMYITYMASKTLAERALWELNEREKPRYALNVILPTWVGGPYVLALPDGAKKLSASVGLLYNCASGGQLPEQDFPFWVDVRDVARAHIMALEKEDVRDKRILVTSGALHYDGVGRNCGGVAERTRKC
jgi:NADPH-dependent methylglyoxal reductase